ncbi:MAG: Unknown protein [uncultured Sulfurovum sp.]|uniref:Porin domain-containing protein n=1 Tax=uncultured Sulfurovum sp. TaxID=269237 RepID=A0A6S6SQH4_9BACT|nr:MAG: Unknown protein [uncultured Sulfurovum sp.]
MKFTKLSLIAAVAASTITMTTSAMAEVEVSANVSATNNYVWRGMSQTNNQAAVQGGLDLSLGGFYLGTWLSNVDFSGGAGAGDTEVDGYAGYAGEIEGLGYDLGYIKYGYLDSPMGNFDEAYLGLSYDFGAVSVGATYSMGIDDFRGTTTEVPDYVAVEASIPVVQDYSLDLGYGDYDTFGSNYSVGLSKSFDKVDFSIAYSSFDHETTASSDENNVIVSAGTSF